MRRYRNMEAYPRMFARMKMRTDPMFPRLAELVGSPRNIIDIGCGFGVPAVWLLEIIPAARVYALEPDGERARVAALAFGERGEARIGRAPEIPSVPASAEIALMIDIIHLLSDHELRETLARLTKALAPRGRGRLVLRETIPSGKRFPWKRRIEELRLRLACRSPFYRTEEMIAELIREAGFSTPLMERISGCEEVWFIAATQAAAVRRRRRS
jgi:trans-aconitate methyltransferase